MLIIVNSDQFGSAMVPVLAAVFFMRSGLMNLAMSVMYGLSLEMLMIKEHHWQVCKHYAVAVSVL